MLNFVKYNFFIDVQIKFNLFCKYYFFIDIQINIIKLEILDYSVYKLIRIYNYVIK